MFNIDDELLEEDFLDEDIDFDIPSIDLVEDEEVSELPSERVEIKGVTSQEELEYLSSMFSKQSDVSLPVYLVIDDNRHKVGQTELDYKMFLTLRNIRDSYVITVVSGNDRKDIISPELSEEAILENLFLFIRTR